MFKVGTESEDKLKRQRQKAVYPENLEEFPYLVPDITYHGLQTLQSLALWGRENTRLPRNIGDKVGWSVRNYQNSFFITNPKQGEYYLGLLALYEAAERQLLPKSPRNRIFKALNGLLTGSVTSFRDLEPRTRVALAEQFPDARKKFFDEIIENLHQAIEQLPLIIKPDRLKNTGMEDQTIADLREVCDLISNNDSIVIARISIDIAQGLLLMMRSIHTADRELFLSYLLPRLLPEYSGEMSLRQLVERLETLQSYGLLLPREFLGYNDLLGKGHEPRENTSEIHRDSTEALQEVQIDAVNKNRVTELLNEIDAHIKKEYGSEYLDYVWIRQNKSTICAAIKQLMASPSTEELWNARQTGTNSTEYSDANSMTSSFLDFSLKFDSDESEVILVKTVMYCRKVLRMLYKI